MPLTFDWTATDLDADNQNDQNLAECAIFATVAVGINHITEANCLDFYKRINFYERLNGPYRYHFDPKTNQRVDDFFTPEDVVRLIGLRTNASTMTLPQFRKAMWEAHDRWNFSYNFKMPLDKPAPVV